tara:strand:+ start:612 stop:1157 length:546 start_codon:yes stop_codon:yes gene_type:complete
MAIFANQIFPAAGEQGTGGGIIQVKYMLKTSRSLYNGGSFAEIGGLDVGITPQSNTNKILIMSSWSMSSSDGGSLPYPILRLRRRIGDNSQSFTTLEQGDAHSNRTRGMVGTSPASGSGSQCQVFAFNYIDTPNTTSFCTYMWEAKCYSSRYLTINGSGTHSDGNVAVAGIATMIAMEFSS